MEPLATTADIFTIVSTLKPFFERLRNNHVLNNGLKEGVVNRSKLMSKKRLPGEVFAAEILKEPVRIEKSAKSGNVQVIINRQNVDKAVISNKGKSELCKSFIEPEFEKIIALDRSIHAFLRNSLSKVITKPLVLPSIPFRWGSGGILSIVNIDDKPYIPMFFRDIPPEGWNLPLGSSERLLDNNGCLISGLDHELNSPSLFILREFLEEMLLIDRDPSCCRPKQFRFRMPYDLGSAQASIAKELKNKHLQLRHKYDHMEICNDNDLVIRPDLLKTPMDLIIHSSEGDFEISDVIFSINCLELGIEIVKIIAYDIPGGNRPYFLDGEILENPSMPELVRMPIALFPLKMLYEIFSGNIELQYRGKSQASIEITHQLNTEDILLYSWDVERRKAIIEDSSLGIGTENTRYSKWNKSFGESFNNGSIPHLFTPASVKILNLLFAIDIDEELKRTKAFSGAQKERAH